MKVRAVSRLGLLVLTLVLVTSALPMLSHIWGAGSIVLSYAGAPPAVSAAWTTANVVSGSIWAFSGIAAPLVVFQLG